MGNSGETDYWYFWKWLNRFIKNTS